MPTRPPGLDPPTPPHFLFLGKDPCLDFLNTRPVVVGERRELLRRFEDVVSWLVEAGLLDGPEGERARQRFAATEEAASTVVAAHLLRTAVEGLVGGLAAGQEPDGDAVALLNRHLAASSRRSRLVWREASFALETGSVIERAGQLLAPVAAAAADFLVDADPRLIKRCEDPACVLWFYDRTRNRSRRWCSMATCGNRHKVARHYRRKQRRTGA